MPQPVSDSRECLDKAKVLSGKDSPDQAKPLDIGNKAVLNTMQHIYGLPIISTYVVEIVNKRLANAAPRQKLLHMGILTIIDYLRARHETPTAQRIAELTGVDYPNTTRYINAMVAAGILEKRPIANRQGRGRAYELYFARTPELHELIQSTLAPLPKRESGPKGTTDEK